MFHSAPMATREVDDIRAGIGMRLKAAREAANLTQDAVASRFSVGKGTVSAWETGRGDPGVSRLRELAKLYKVSADGHIEAARLDLVIRWPCSISGISVDVTIRAIGLADVARAAAKPGFTADAAEEVKLRRYDETVLAAALATAVWRLPSRSCMRSARRCSPS